jgi:ubiquitin carboxyl-terminal hydrolase L5
MVQDPRVNAAAIGDVETLAREEQKREAWLWENELRRHNFVGFVHEVAKEVVRSKGKEEGGFDKWIEDAREKSKERLEKKQKGGAQEDVEMEF